MGGDIEVIADYDSTLVDYHAPPSAAYCSQGERSTGFGNQEDRTFAIAPGGECHPYPLLPRFAR